MSRYRATMSELLQKVHEQDKDHEVSMARGELEAIADKATQLASALKGKSDEGNPLEAWVQSKITKAKDYINSVSDYMLYNPDMKQNEETILEKTYGWTLVSKAKDLAKKFANNYTKAVDEIEKLEKGLSKNPTVEKELMKYNEEVELEEGKIKDIFTANKEGESIEQIAKRLNMSVATVKKLLGEEIIDEKIADSIIKDLQKAYGDLKGKTISPEMATKISKHLDGQSFDVVTLRQLMKANIPFISTIARNKIYKKTGKFEEVELEEVKTPSIEPDKRSDGEKDIDKIKLAKEKDTDAIEKQLIAAQGQINILKQKLENEKNKVIKPEPNPETGEVPLTVGVAYKYFKDKEMKKESVDNYPTSDIAKHKKDVAADPKMGEKKPVHLGAKMTYESIAAVKNKAEKTGMPYSILKQVYDRGMAAWRGGHRPGATQVQWALARVNSFVTKSSGTWGGADSDLAKKVKGEK